MNKNLMAIFLALNILTVNVVVAAPNFKYEQTQIQPSANTLNFEQPYEYTGNNTLKGNVVMVPAGTCLKATLTTPLSSEYASIGQNVTMALNSNFYYEDKLIAPAGSTVSGTVIEVEKARRGTLPGKLCIRFNRIYTPYGNQIPISALIKTEDKTGVLLGGTKAEISKDYILDITAGSAAGALSGLVFGALAGGNPGRGAALGTAIGAGGGLAKSALDKGGTVEIPTGASVDLVLTQPITVSSPSYYNEN